MATNPVPHSDNSSGTKSEAVLLPSQRVVVPPTPGTSEAAFLDNLNTVYGSDNDRDEHALPGAMRSHMRGALTRDQ